MGVVAALLVLAGGAGYRLGVAHQPAATTTGPPGSARVVRIVDGDTIHVMLNGIDEAVRLIGIDTPETHGKGGLRECFGAEATRRISALIPPGTQVRVVRDAEARDRYGRLLAYIYRRSDGLFVNLTLVKEGYAVAFTFPPNVAHVDEFVAAGRTSRDANKGLWSKCGGPDTPIG